MIPTSFLAAPVLNEVALDQHLDVALNGLGRNTCLSLNTRDFQPWISLDSA